MKSPCAKSRRRPLHPRPSSRRSRPRSPGRHPPQRPISFPDSLVDDKATELLQLARAVPAPGPDPHGIADVGLTEGGLDLLETHIETCNLLLGTPRAARGTKTAATGNLQQTLDEIGRLLEKGLDKLALQFKGTTFHQEYLLARDPAAGARTQPAPVTPPPAPIP